MKINVPIQMCVYVVQNNLGCYFKLFLTLKLLYPFGKFIRKEEEEYIAFIMLSHTRTIRNGVAKLNEIGWLNFNPKTGYHTLCSFDVIRKQNDWISRTSIPVGYDEVDNIKGLLGAAIFGCLYRYFYRKLKVEKSVQVKGCTYNFLSFKNNYKNTSAPIALEGVKKIFDIPIATASRLKQAAVRYGFIKVEKTYHPLDNNELVVMQMKKYYGGSEHVIQQKGKAVLQGIDNITPLYSFTKRKKLER